MFRELISLHFNFVVTLCDNFERYYLQKYDFDYMASGDLHSQSNQLVRGFNDPFHIIS